MQVVERMGNWMLMGHHDPGGGLIWAFNATTLERQPLQFGLMSRQYGVFALHHSSDDCLWVGGDMRRTRGGQWMGGFARMCEPEAFDNTPPAAPAGAAAELTGSTVELTWGPGGGDVDVRGHLVHDNYQYLGWVGQGRNNFEHEIEPASRHRYQVRAQDGAGNNSDPTPMIVVDPSTGDDAPPTTPEDLEVEMVAGDAVLNWEPATDDTRVAGYLVHDNWDYVAFVSNGTSFRLPDIEPGSTHRFQVRAQDGAGNNSSPTPLVRLEP